ncbi:uncharacterized protein LOC143300701 [Babylonia areolata]|uniref:uncharacterized protein LOC143300701 n=1 Tax=Babylonia areolata TaxID=304850 RepID=UPI003FD2F6DC
MDRWQLWRRVWFRMNRKTHSRRQYAVAHRTRSDPEGRRSQPPPPARYMLGRQHFVFVTSLASGISQRPKVLLDVDCSDLLLGGSEELENFSSTCWLEDHLHRFGRPSQSAPESTPHVGTSYEFHGVTELEASSSSAEIADSFEDYSADSGEEQDEDVPSTSGSTRNGFVGDSSNGNVINLHRFPYVEPDASMPEPPPYQDEPPPSYEEAIADRNFFSDNDGTDFLW